MIKGNLLVSHWLSQFLLFPSAYSQPVRILHYTETSGFDHRTRNVSFAMFQQMGLEYGFTVDHDSTGQMFNSLAQLQQYAAVVFSNTSGDNLLDPAQKQNFEQYMNGGGSFIGIHAASDTYRHSSANGTGTGAWDWYAEMLGASVQQNPNHVSGTPVYRIDAVSAHVLLNNVPSPWNKAEEYYYWLNGYYDSSNIVLQMVEQTIGPNLMVNDYDSARAVTWYRMLNGGGKVFYTSLGHAEGNYNSDTSFYRLLANAVLWAGNITSGIHTPAHQDQWFVFPNPTTGKLHVISSLISEDFEMNIYNSIGEKVGSGYFKSGKGEVDTDSYLPGNYFIQVGNGSKSITLNFIKN